MESWHTGFNSQNDKEKRVSFQVSPHFSLIINTKKGGMEIKNMTTFLFYKIKGTKLGKVKCTRYPDKREFIDES